MIVGFTGTRRGMTESQRLALTGLLAYVIPPAEVRHGDCVGADAEFADICATLSPRPRIVALPGESAKGGENHLRANSPHNDEVLATKTHFARNRDIVDACDVLVGTPGEMERQASGGTWYTLDYAAKKGKRVVIVWPNGEVTEP